MGNKRSSIIRMGPNPSSRSNAAQRILHKLSRVIAERKKGLGRAVALTTLGCVLGAANAPSSGLEQIGARVSDSELSEMRGKFISPERISFFGVQMATSWQGPDGVTTYATLVFNVDFAAGAGNFEGATPQLLIAWSRDCETCGDNAMDVIGFGQAAQDGYVVIDTGSGGLSVGGLNSVQGAVQSQQIAGTDNRVLNGMQIAIVPASMVSGKNGEGLTPITTGASHTFADGDTLQFILDPGEIGLALGSGSNSDAIRQSVGASQAAQHVLLNSSHNSIFNNMTLTVGLNDLKQSDRVSAQYALSAMKGHGF